MTTNALAKSIIHYPLNYIVFAYNDPLEAINLIASRSTIHQEFEKRNDAARVIIDLFSKTDGVEMDPQKHSSGFNCLQYSDEMFLEYYMASKRIPNIYSEETTERLGAAINKKLMERLSLPDRFSFFSLQPLLIMGASPELTQYVMNIPEPPINGTSIVYTPFGKSITATLYQDYSQQERAAISLYYVLEYPDADLVSTATHIYNCHSFAWHRQNEYNNVWINYTILGIFRHK